MALNDGYATDGAGATASTFRRSVNRAWFLRRSHEAKFNGAVFTYGLVTFGLAFVVLP